MTKYVIINLYLLMAISVFAQDGVKIRGKVVDERNEALPYANVVLRDTDDSTSIAGYGMTDGDGSFSVAVEENRRVDIVVSYVGYEPYIIKGATGDIGIIALHPDDFIIADVVVKGRRPVQRLTAEGLVTNVDGTVLGEIGTAEDVLSHIPRLDKNGDGTYNVSGKGEPVFYINGRKVTDLSELDRLKSSDIKNIILITAPGARYDASVNAIVKIVTKQAEGDGFSINSRLTYSQSRFKSSGVQTDLNYRSGGLDLFSTLRFNSREEYQYTKDTRSIDDTGTLWDYDCSLYHSWRNNLATIKGGLNYVTGQDNSFGFFYELTQSLPMHDNGTSSSLVTAGGGIYDGLENSIKGIYGSVPFHSANIYYNGKIGKTAIDFNADWRRDKRSTDYAYIEISNSFDDRTVTNSNSVSNSLLAAKLVASHGLFGGNLSVGVEYTYVRRDEDYSNAEGYFSNAQTKMRERTSAPFVEYSHELPFGSLLAGLRYEHASFDYYNAGVRNPEQSRSYSNFFPSLSLSAKAGKVNTKLDYDVSIRRPGYYQLTSTVSYLDRFLQQTGNPYLKPSIIHNISLHSIWKILSVSIEYRDIRDAIIDTGGISDNIPPAVVLCRENVESLKSLSTYITLSPVIGIWHPQFAAGFSKQWLTLPTEYGDINMDKPVYIAEMNNTFKFSDTLVGDLTAKFRSKGSEENTYLTENIVRANIGIMKWFWDKRLSVRLSANDIFHTKAKQRVYFSRFSSDSAYKYDSRMINLTIRYNFNTVQSKYKGTGAGNAAKKRL